MSVLIDTGPLVAYFNRRDPWHRWVSHKMGTIRESLLTCEAVISESCFILQREQLSPEPIFRMAEQQVLKVAPAFDTNAAQNRVTAIIETYSNLPASFADACLVSMYESIFEVRIFTLDIDFSIYRTQAGDPLSLISPNA